MRGRTEHYDPAYLSADPAFAHAHVTLLGPFLPLDDLGPDTRERVGEILRQHDPFEVVLDRVATFPDGTIHLTVEPDAPVRALTADLWAAFPQCPPYGGRYGDVAPHLTLDRVGPGVTEAGVRDWVDDLLPARLEVGEVRLSWYEQDACRTLTRLPLGQSGWSRPTATTEAW